MSLTGKPSLTTNSTISNDSFWPDLSVGDLMDQYRIPSEYADKVIITGLTLAIIRVNEALKPVQDVIVALPFASLADYTAANSQQVGGEEILLTHYKTAVFTRAKAGLLKQFNSLNRKPAAENVAKESDDTEEYWLDESQASIAALFRVFLPDETVLNKANIHVSLM